MYSAKISTFRVVYAKCMRTGFELQGQTLQFTARLLEIKDKYKLYQIL